MRQAIVTKYDYRGSRVKAKADAGSVTVGWDYALGVDENHTKAAIALANKFGWLEDQWTLIGGGMPGNTGNCYVLVPSDMSKHTASEPIAVSTCQSPADASSCPRCRQLDREVTHSKRKAILGGYADVLRARGE